jgi:hypothetical protein
MMPDLNAQRRFGGFVPDCERVYGMWQPCQWRLFG